MLLVSDNRQAGRLPAIIGRERLLVCALADAPMRPDDIVVIDVDLADAHTRRAVLDLFGKARPRRALAVSLDLDSEEARRTAHKLGATVLLDRPLTAGALYRVLDRLEPGHGPAPVVSAQSQCAAALADAHCALCSRQELDLGALRLAAGDCVGAIADYGIDVWFAAAAERQDGLQRHALCCAGAAAGFGRQLGMNDKDLELLTLAAFIADLGMAGLPQSLIDKKTELDREEAALIDRHPVVAHDYLKTHAALPQMVLDAVRQHHELCDGSGSPEGLDGTAISDLTHVLTICDLFADLAFSCSTGTAPEPGEAMAVLDVMVREKKLRPGPVGVLAAALAGTIGWPRQAVARRA